MKRTLILLVILVMAGSAEAKIRVGLKGGMNFASLTGSPRYNFSNRTGWHVGAMMNISFPFGLTLQPELLYNSKGSNWNSKGTIEEYFEVPLDPQLLSKKRSFSVGYIELPIDLQWGIKLPLLRPYLSLTPYVGYAVNSGGVLRRHINEWDGGVGIGAGVDIWKLQVSVKYFFGFGKVSELFRDSSMQNRNLMFSLGIFL